MPAFSEISDPARLPTAPKVSVLVITYNQEQYIAATLESAVVQSTFFPFEIVIGEDCSTDSTRAICLDFQRRHPEKVRLLFPKANLGFQQNLRGIINECRGTYVAILEGDDLWIDQRKLEIQTTALDATPSTNICVTRGRRLFPDGSEQSDWDRGEKARVIPLAELASYQGMLAPTASVFARRDSLLSLPRWIAEAPVWDMFAILCLAAPNGALYLPVETCLYRVTSVGSWTGAFARYFEKSKIEYSERMLRAYHLTADTIKLRRRTFSKQLSSFHLILGRDAYLRASYLQAINHFIRLHPVFILEAILRRGQRIIDQIRARFGDFLAILLATFLT